MKHSKITLLITAVTLLSFSFVSCKKNSEDVNSTIKAEQLYGSYNMQLNKPGVTQQFHVTLKPNGVMEMDAMPYDGVPDIIISWETGQNKFHAHLDAQGITNLWDFNGIVDPSTLFISGQFKLNDPQSPEEAVFTIEKP